MAESSRPVLLPQNRKIRHLQGIVLRNLSFDRPKGHATDDSAVKHSSSQVESLRHNATLHHSASVESLRPATARRRSTNLGNATPFVRQKHLEASIEKRVADAFFTLHIAGQEEPFYISEVAQRSTNFDFRFFELFRAVEPGVLRSPQLIVKVWTCRMGEWTLHLEQLVDLRRLNFLGSMLGVHFPFNCLVFHLVDGIYTFDFPEKTFPPRQGTAQPTSSYNALMRLSTLEQSIQDALATQDLLKDQINQIIASQFDTKVAITEAQDKLTLTNKYISAEQRGVKAAIEQIENLNSSISDRREMIADGRTLMGKTEEDMNNALAKLNADKEQCKKIKDDIRGQRRRICEDLSAIFRIEPMADGKPLHFQIRGIPLPNAEAYGGAMLSGAQEDELSAALGHVALLTKHLEMYLSVPLPYPITYCGSRSYITDDISVLKDPVRDFPLYLPRGGSAAQFRFDYGWFILNKDIETLCAAQGLKVMDIRHTLPNLKYLLYVCSAGSNELPERKKGGVRGLRAGIMRSRGVSLTDDSESIMSSRRGSVDSDMPRGSRFSSDDPQRNLDTLDTLDSKGPEVTTSGQEAEMPEISLPFNDEFGKLTLRTKGMRENLAG